MTCIDPVVRGRPVLLAIVGHTASGKSALAVTLAERHRGEIVSCDSTAVYRGVDIGTDKMPEAERRGVPHHLVDVVEPTGSYSAARYAGEAAAAIRDITARGKLPILAGGTGLYYRALTRGLFPGPGRNTAVRGRLERMARRYGPERLHGWLDRVDAESAARIQPRDTKRLVRALEVYHLTRVPLSEHFAATRSPIAGYRVLGFALHLPAAERAERIARRVDDQFRRGLTDEIRGLLARGVPETAHPFTGLVYRQALELLHGIRGEAETRALIVQENRRYARRQLIWFRKEPNLYWVSGPGERGETACEVERVAFERLARPDEDISE